MPSKWKAGTLRWKPSPNKRKWGKSKTKAEAKSLKENKSKVTMTKWVEELEKENRKIKKEYSEYVDAKEMELKHATYTCS